MDSRRVKLTDSLLREYAECQLFPFYWRHHSQLRLHEVQWKHWTRSSSASRQTTGVSENGQKTRKRLDPSPLSPLGRFFTIAAIIACNTSTRCHRKEIVINVETDARRLIALLGSGVNSSSVSIC